MRAVIVGGGLAGLAAAVRLADAGHTVTVIEKNGTPGGKLAEHIARGFRFDLGPSLLTLPGIYDRLLQGGDGTEESAGGGTDHCHASPLDPLCSYFWSDGTVVRSTTDASRFDSILSTHLNEAKGAYVRYLDDAKKLYNTIAPIFLTRSIHHRSLFGSRDFWRTLPRLPAALTRLSVAEHTSTYFRDARTCQLFSRYSTYNGSSPYLQSAMYSLISCVEHRGGGYAPAGGMRGLADRLVARAQRAGVQFALNSLADAIELRRSGARRRRAAVAVHTTPPSPAGEAPSGTGRGGGAGKTYPCDTLIMAGDYHNARKLLARESRRGGDGKKPASPRSRRRDALSTSAVIFLWGIAATHPQLSVHNILFSNDYHEEFDDIFRCGQAPTDPTIYINISSKYNPPDAPQGCENWFVMINVPATLQVDWAAVARDLQWKAMQKIHASLGIDVDKKLLYSKTITPPDLCNATAAQGGALYGNSTHGLLAALRRPANFDKKIRNCFYCGGTVHPGGGIPLALLSGQIAAALADPRIPAPVIDLL